MEIEWWEKHVEWEFVREFLTKLNVSLPIDGDIEISDALVAVDSQWMLLEFKRDLEGQGDELAKYPSLSWVRACAVANRIYKKFYPNDVAALNAELKGVKPKPHQVATITLRWEAALALQYGWFAHDCVFHRADAALNSLFNGLPPANVGPNEPHMFIYASDHTFIPLRRSFYWGEWSRFANTRNADHQDMKKLSALSGGALDFVDFYSYLDLLLQARGFLVENIIASNGSPNPFSRLMFANTVAFGRGGNGVTVILPLYDVVKQLTNFRDAALRALRIRHPGRAYKAVDGRWKIKRTD
ncbi:hypothetical protein [Burkholderia gladioli]|uniref:hypothetical protein n=1 Tax=Burkholderia gladioli TaxID=28095 RepID=UPI00164075AE|nr:hypothetical protein [Burkholderia gladioli]